MQDFKEYFLTILLFTYVKDITNTRSIPIKSTKPNDNRCFFILGTLFAINYMADSSLII